MKHLLKLSLRASLFPPHRHIFDSANGVDDFGDVIRFRCKCGAGRLVWKAGAQ